MVLQDRSADWHVENTTEKKGEYFICGDIFWENLIRVGRHAYKEWYYTLAHKKVCPGLHAV